MKAGMYLLATCGFKSGTQADRRASLEPGHTQDHPVLDNNSTIFSNKGEDQPPSVFFLQSFSGVLLNLHPLPHTPLSLSLPGMMLIVCDSSILLLPCIYSTPLPAGSPRYEPSRQPVFAPGNGLFFLLLFFLYPVKPPCLLYRETVSTTNIENKASIKVQTLFYLLILQQEFTPFVPP